MITAIFFSLIASAFFSGMEIAFLSSNKLQFELDKRRNNPIGKVLGVYMKRPDSFISTMSVGYCISLIVYGILMADILREPIQLFVSNKYIIFLLQTIFSTFLIFVLAGLLPKNIFKYNHNLFIRIFALPLLPIYYLLYPISKFVTLISRGILYLFRVKISNTGDAYQLSKIDLDHFVQQGIDHLNMDEEIDPEVKIFQNALDFQNVKIRDCIIPRTEIVAVDYNESLENITSTFIETGFSKIIVYKDTIDNIVGYFHVSEVFKRLKDWHKALQPISIVPESMPANKLLNMLMIQKRSMVVVVDEFGGTAGIVTLEDLMEEIFGDIEDEHDIHPLIAKKKSDGSYIFSGRVEINKINEQFDLNIPEEEDYHTIAGYILEHSQHLPKLNETIEIGAFIIKIIRVTTTKIELVSLQLNESKEEIK